MNLSSHKAPSQEQINALLALFEAKRYSDAIARCKKLTKRFPSHGLAWNILGLSYIYTGTPELALRPLKTTVELAPNSASVRGNLGNVFRDLGRLQEAEHHYRTALKIDSRYLPALINLGAVLLDMNRLDDAEDCYLSALKINPTLASLHRDLGNVLRREGRLSDALACYQSAQSLDPHSYTTYYVWAAALWENGEVEKAIEYYQKALNLNPDLAGAHNDLAVALLKSGQWDDCVTHSQAAIRLNPLLYQPWINLGNAYMELGRLVESEDSYRHALRLKSDSAEAHSNLGRVLRNLMKLQEAEYHCRAALKTSPRYTEAWVNLGNVLKDLGQLVEAEDCYRQVLHLDPYHTNAFSNLLFSMNYRDTDRQESFELARQFGREASFKAQHRFSGGVVKNQTPRLRIGFVSGDLRAHPVGYFLKGLLEHINQNAFELFAYVTHGQADEFTQSIHPYFADWRSLQGLTDEEAAQLIHLDGIQILIDLSGHTGHNRLPVFSYKPAPIQVSWLGYFATTGLTEMDHLLADQFSLPEPETVFFTENIWYLPETRLCFAPPDNDIDVSPLPALTNGFITFGCFNNLTKMNDAVVSLWARILNAVPDGRLFLKSRQLDDSSVRKRTLERFAAQGIIADRLILEGASTRSDYLAAYHRVDFALDPFPFPGGTTSVEGLWMGVPMLTLQGERFLSRQGVGIAMNAGLSAWIAQDEEAYFALAVANATDVAGLAKLRQKLRDQVLASPLFDAKRFASHFEAAMQGMWQQSLTKKKKNQDQVPLDIYKINFGYQNRVVIVSATQRTEDDFWENSALGQSLSHHLKHDDRLCAVVAYGNTRGLPEIYNEAIDLAEEDDVLVFMHDDVWIDEQGSFADILIDGLAQFDVLGVAGNRSRKPGQPAWGFIDSNLTPDNPNNLSGRIAHGEKPFGAMSYFGELPDACELLDGVFIATQKKRLSKQNVRFDPRFDFHFYDLDFCRSARKSGLKLGTWPIRLTHQSQGNYRSAHWRDKSKVYLEKWDKI